MLKFTATIEVVNGEINITPDDYNNSYMEFESFIWDNKDKKVNEIINVLPF